MRASDKIGVLLVDDHPIVREGYRLLLETQSDFVVVGEAESGEQACQLYGEVTPDIVVLDLNMPGMGGLETIRRLLLKDSNARILVFSMQDSQSMVQRVLEAGARGYLTKVSVSSQMVEAVRQVAQGRHYLDPSLASQVMGALSGGGDPLRTLTQREFEVFRNLAVGLSLTEIAEMLSISPKTVAVHQTNIMNKLGLRNGSELTRMAIRHHVIEP